jgi:glycosyltransferase involved in cell wall biosynthesis
MLLRRRTGRRPRQISLAPNVEARRPTIRTRSQVRRRLGLAPHAFLLVFFGFVHPVKGIRYVLEALPTLLAERPDLHLTVVGGFTSQALPEPEAAAFRSELETMAGGLGVRGAVTFTGHLPSAEVSEILHTADAAVLPFTAGVTLKSGALLATMAHGLPTAVTVPDIPDERLRDGENVAVIQRRRDAAAVARTLRRLIGDAALRERLTAGGLALTARHSWPAVAGTHRALYDDVLTHA